jgi:hypothetical protein
MEPSPGSSTTLYASIMNLWVQNQTAYTIGNNKLSVNTTDLSQLTMQYFSTGDNAVQITIALNSYVPDRNARITIGNNCIISIEQFGEGMGTGYRFLVQYTLGDKSYEFRASQLSILYFYSSKLDNINAYGSNYNIFINGYVVSNSGNTNTTINWNGIWYVTISQEILSQSVGMVYNWKQYNLTNPDGSAVSWTNVLNATNGENDIGRDIAGYGIILALILGILFSVWQRDNFARLIIVWSIVIFFILICSIFWMQLI